MKSNKPVIILAGQVYFDDDKNDYLVVKRKQGEVVCYAGRGFRGMLEDEVFLQKFQPVDPEDLTVAEVEFLKDLLPTDTIPLSTGFIND
jgi:hypothetical protein